MAVTVAKRCSAMQCDRFGDIDVADTVTVGQAEGLIVVEIGQYALDAAADHGLFAGVDQRDRPRLDLPGGSSSVVPHVERDIGLCRK